MVPQLSCYYIKIRERRKRLDLDLFAFDGSTDFIDVIHGWLSELVGTPFQGLNSKRTIHFDTGHSINRTERIISDRIKTGRTGIGGDIYRKRSKPTVVHKDKDDIDAVSLFFVFDIPSPGQVGYFLCLDFDGLCPYGSMYEFIRDKFKKQYPDYTLKIEPVVFNDIVKKYIEDGLLIAFELRKKSLNKDHAELLCANPNDFGIPKMTLSVSADTRRDKKFNQSVYKTLKDNLEKGTKTFIDFPYDEAYVEFKLKGIVRKVKVENHYAHANKAALSEDILLDSDGIPDYNKVLEEARTIIDNLK